MNENKCNEKNQSKFWKRKKIDNRNELFFPQTLF